MCERDSIAGHGRRRKQVHDEPYDWIPIRLGHCRGCGKTFTFLPPRSLPHTHYSLLTRCQALRRRLVEHRSWEEATTPLKDPNRLPDPSTLRRRAHGLNRAHPARPFLRQTPARAGQWLGRDDQADHKALSGMAPILQVLLRHLSVDNSVLSNPEKRLTLPKNCWAAYVFREPKVKATANPFHRNSRHPGKTSPSRRRGSGNNDGWRGVRRRSENLGLLSMGGAQVHGHQACQIPDSKSPVTDRITNAGGPTARQQSPTRRMQIANGRAADSSLQSGRSGSRSAVVAKQGLPSGNWDDNIRVKP